MCSSDLLGLIQEVIARMAGASASTKRIAVVVVGGAVAIAARSNGTANVLPLLAVILVVILWWVDGRYVQRERWFRDHYDLVASEAPDRRPDFRITPPDQVKAGHRFRAAAGSGSTAPYYIALCVFLLLSWSTIS